MIKLTSRQKQVLDLIKDHITETGYPPTRADIAKQLGFKSANAAEEHLRALARKGFIEIVPGASRGIRIPAPINQGIPIVGRVAAGSPILASEHIEDYCELKPNFFSPAADYFLTVRGESMIDIGIFDGDLLAVHSTTQVQNGQIVVARIGDEVTVKRFQQEKNSQTVHLIAENKDYAAIVVDLKKEAFSIEGISVGVIRQH
ncbi:MAG: repressor LexA [Pseudohongiellaceae bacterium]|jgi:repressor LexA